MNQDKDIQQLKNRLSDLADKSYQQGIFTFSSFMGLAEQDVFHAVEREISYVKPVLWGGHRTAERVVVRFGSAEELGYEMPYPISCVHIEPLSPKFAEKLSHRDFLGALMNLGIERATLGDILVNEKEAWLFCLDSIVEYICDSLDKVRHNSVKCTVVDLNDTSVSIPSEEPQVLTIQVASLRADAVISKVYNLSRDASLSLFQAQKVYINGRLCENNSAKVRAGDTINARGFGKFTLNDDGRLTKKGRISLSVGVYR